MMATTNRGEPVENDETGVWAMRGPVEQASTPNDPLYTRVDRTTPYRTPCTVDCDSMTTEKKECFGAKMQQLWDSIPESSNACHHWRSWENVKEAMKKRYPKLKSVTLLGLKKLLCADLNQNETTYSLVKLENFLKLVKCFGPFEEGSGQCYTLTQFEKFLTESARKIGTSNISWFAGDISREEAEDFLEGQRRGTYLVRLSQSEFGAFALSVVAVEGEPPIHEIFKFQKDSDDNAEYIFFNQRKFYSALKVIKHCQDEPFDAEYGDLRCKHECPNLPFNRIVTGYRGKHK